MARKPVELETPLPAEAVWKLKAGDQVFLNGVIYGARDAAHARMVALLDGGNPLPFPIEGAVIYYVGPSPTPPGKVIGSAGPTTSVRMDAYTPRLLEVGLRGMIGKGSRSAAVREAMKKHPAVYFGAVGGAAALISRRIIASEVVAWPELGPEAVTRMTVSDFPVTVINDCHGGDLYEEGRAKYRIA